MKPYGGHLAMFIFLPAHRKPRLVLRQPSLTDLAETFSLTFCPRASAILPCWSPSPGSALSRWSRSSFGYPHVLCHPCPRVSRWPRRFYLRGWPAPMARLIMEASIHALRDVIRFATEQIAD